MITFPPWSPKIYPAAKHVIHVAVDNIVGDLDSPCFQTSSFSALFGACSAEDRGASDDQISREIRIVNGSPLNATR